MGYASSSDSESSSTLSKMLRGPPLWPTSRWPFDTTIVPDILGWTYTGIHDKRLCEIMFNHTEIWRRFNSQSEMMKLRFMSKFIFVMMNLEDIFYSENILPLLADKEWEGLTVDENQKKKQAFRRISDAYEDRCNTIEKYAEDLVQDEEDRPAIWNSYRLIGARKFAIFNKETDERIVENTKTLNSKSHGCQEIATCGGTKEEVWKDFPHYYSDTESEIESGSEGYGTDDCEHSVTGSETGSECVV